jgi:membrane-associated phospholipid phosphatase
LIPSAMVAIIFWKKNRPVANKGLYIFSVVALSGILVNIIKLATRRVRPTLYFSEGLYGFNFFEFDSDFMSFPSGHSATSLSAAVALGFLFPKLRIPFLIVGMMIAFTRMFLTNHFLSDVMAGGMLGVVTSILLYQSYFQQRMERQTDPQQIG